MIVDRLAVLTQAMTNMIAVDFDHRFLEGQVACPFPGPCLICRWYSPAFLDSLEVRP